MTFPCGYPDEMPLTEDLAFWILKYLNIAETKSQKNRYIKIQIMDGDFSPNVTFPTWKEEGCWYGYGVNRKQMTTDITIKIGSKWLTKNLPPNILAEWIAQRMLYGFENSS